MGLRQALGLSRPLEGGCGTTWHIPGTMLTEKNEPPNHNSSGFTMCSCAVLAPGYHCDNSRLIMACIPWDLQSKSSSAQPQAHGAGITPGA
jgi:hypothetical protein